MDSRVNDTWPAGVKFGNGQKDLETDKAHFNP